MKPPLTTWGIVIEGEYDRKGCRDASNTDGFAVGSGPGMSPERFVMLA